MCNFVSGGVALTTLACCAAQFSVAQDTPVASPETEQHIQLVASGRTSEQHKPSQRFHFVLGWVKI